MANTVLIGAQWGDEGKGKVIDVLARDADVVARYQGGSNAGHTVKTGEHEYVLHLVPSGAFHERTACVIGNGVVVDPLALVKEIDGLEATGVTLGRRLFVSDRAHLILPYHRAIDECREERQTGGHRLGTTKRGIGPAYGDKASRQGLRVGDLLDPAFPELLTRRIEDANRVLASLGGNPFPATPVLEEHRVAAARLRPFVTDTVMFLNRCIADGKSILFEGAQGTMLDIDFGTYPFVTSSNTTVGGACAGTGVAPRHIDRVIGVLKAYTTRVGEGPFPTELNDSTGAFLRDAGGEYGATTGRPRRCGWFDAVVARYSAMVNGIDCWAMTKLDVLDSLDSIRICTAYEHDGRRYDNVPASLTALRACRPVYEEWPGWRTSTKDVTSWDALPVRAREYVSRLCEITDVKLGMLSVGPRRDNTLRIAV